MTEILSSTWQLVVGVFSSIWGIIAAVGTWCFDILLVLHTGYPRLEGLLVGVLFAYFYAHRDKNPWVRTIAAPLTIIIDIIDICWDETVEALRDLAGDVWDRISVVGSSVSGKVKAGWNWLLGRLRSVKDRIAKKSDEA